MKFDRRILLILVWGAFVLWGYSSPDRVPLYSLLAWAPALPPVWNMSGSALGNHLGHLLRFAFLVLLSGAIGRACVVRLLKINGFNVFEGVFISYALGLGLSGCVFFLMGACGVLRPAPVWSVVVAAVAAGVWFNRDLAVRGARIADPALIPTGWSIPIALMASAALAVTGFYALGPEIYYDSLVYHLALPSLYWMKGGFVPTPELLYSGIPMQFEMVFGWALFFDGEILAKLLHWSTGAAVAAGLVGAGLRFRRPLAGWAGALIYLTTPLIGDSLYRSGIEGASALWIFASVWSAGTHLNAAKEDGSKDGLLRLSAVFAGLALATKYTNWPFLGVMAAGLLWSGLRPKSVLGYCLTALAFVAPWVLKNIWFYGNPIFPFFHDTFRPLAEYPVNWRLLHADARGRNWDYLLGHGGGLLRVLAHPWFATVEGRNDDDHLGPIYLILLPLLFGPKLFSRANGLFSWAFFGLWLCWWPLTGLPRFFMPGLAVLSLLIGGAVAETKPPWTKGVLAAGILLLSLNNLTVIVQHAFTFREWPYLIRGAPKEEYLKHPRPTYPVPAFASIEWINENTPEAAKILLVGDARMFYLKREFVASSQLDTPILFHLLDKSRSADELYRRLHDRGITHILLNMGLLARLAPPPDADGSRKAILENFVANHLEQKFVDKVPSDQRWSFVYAVVPEARTQERPTGDLLYWFSRKRRT